MLHRIPPDVKRFKVSITSLFLYSICCGFIGIVVGLLVLAIQYGHSIMSYFLRITWIAMPLIFLCCVVGTLVVYIIANPVGFSTDGIYASSPWIGQRFIRWADIAKVRKLTLLNLRFLLIYSSIDGKITSLSLFSSRQNEFRDEIRKFAPPNSPVLDFLN